MGNCTNCVQQQSQQRSGLTSSSSFDNLSRSLHRNFIPNRFRTIRTFSPYNLNTLIDETLSIIRTVVDTDQEPPHAMLVVSRIASREDRWLDVMIALIDRVPITDPLGATVIALLLDECSLPSRELLHQLIKRICSDNRNRIKILQSIIEEYIKENSKQLSSIVETDINEDERDVNEVIPVVKNSTHEGIPEQHER
jgi:hypothetical protein